MHAAYLKLYPILQKSSAMATAEPHRQPRAVLSGSSASDGRRGSDQSLRSASLESQRSRTSADSLSLKPLNKEVTYPRKPEPNRWETALQEISEISPDPSTAVLKPAAGDTEAVHRGWEGGRPVRSHRHSEIQSLPDTGLRTQREEAWQETGQPAKPSGVTERQVPPRRLSGRLSEAFTPPEGKSARLNAQKGQSGKAVKEQKAAPSQGRAMSFLLTTMPEITDIGFRGGINFVKKLSRGSLSEQPRLKKASVPRQAAQPAAADPGTCNHQKQPEQPQERRVRKERPVKKSSGPSADAQDRASLQALLDKGPLKRSPLADKRLPAQGNDWLYATMPVVSTQRSPPNLHVLSTSARKSGKQRCLLFQREIPFPSSARPVYLCMQFFALIFCRTCKGFTWFRFVQQGRRCHIRAVLLMSLFFSHFLSPSTPCIS